MDQEPFVELSDVESDLWRGRRKCAGDRSTSRSSIGQGRFRRCCWPERVRQIIADEARHRPLAADRWRDLRRRQESHEAGQGVGMAFQNSTLMPWRTTLSNIMLPFEIVEPHKRRLRANKKEYVATGGATTCIRRARQFRREISRGSCLAACSNAPIFVAR